MSQIAMEPEIEVEIIHGSDASRVILGDHPLIIRGLPVGPCVWLWNDPEYLKSRVSSDKRVTVHVCKTTDMNFVSKNFDYRTLPFHAFLDRAVSKGKLGDYFWCNEEKYYLRALGDDPRKEPAMFEKHFPELAPDVHIPDIFPKERLFSSVLRGGSAGVRLWTHYDVMDNILIQIVGRKTVVLFDPVDVPYLYLNGDKSEVIDVDRPNLMQHPLFANAKRYRARMVPGDILYIPALWFHNVVAEDFSLAVNAFWRSKRIRDDHYNSKDVYGNSDLLPAQRALQGVEKAIKQLEELPEPYRRFYAYRCIEAIRKKFQLPRTIFATGDSTFDISAADSSSSQSLLQPVVTNAMAVVSDCKPDSTIGRSSSSVHSYKSRSPNRSFHNVYGGQNSLSGQDWSLSNVCLGPFCIPPPPLPTSGRMIGLKPPSGLAQTDVVTPVPLEIGQPPPVLSSFSSILSSLFDNGARINGNASGYSDHETVEFASSLNSKSSPLSSTLEQCQRPIIPMTDLSFNGSNTGLGNLNMAQQQEPLPQYRPPPARREKKLLRFIDPKTGKALLEDGSGESETFRQKTVDVWGNTSAITWEPLQPPAATYVSTPKPLFGAIGESRIFRQSTDNGVKSDDVLSAGDILMKADEHDGDMAMVTDEKEKDGSNSECAGPESVERAPELIRKYSREFMAKVATFPKSNMKPDFPMVRWSKDSWVQVFDSTKKEEERQPRGQASNRTLRSSRPNRRERRRRKMTSTAAGDAASNPLCEPKSNISASCTSFPVSKTSSAERVSAKKPVGLTARLAPKPGMKAEPKADGGGDKRQAKRQVSADYLHAWIDELDLDPARRRATDQ